MILVTTTVTVTIIFMAPAAWAQKTSAMMYRQPEEVSFYDNSPPVDASDTSNVYGSFMETRFFPVGWSRQGKFAYFTYFDDYDASGMAWLTLYVFDAKNDTILVQLSPEKEYWTETPFDTIWRENKKFFSRLLDSFGLIQQKSMIRLLKFPIVSKHDNRNDTIMWSADTNWVEADSSPYGFPCYDSLAITLSTSGQSGSGQVIYDKYSDYVAIGFSIPGFIQDPFDPNVIFIPLVLSHWGWEGPPHTTSITPIGVALEKEKK